MAFTQSNLKYLLSALLGILLLSIILLSWVPPISRDALTHHLVIPKLYINHGGMYEIPSIKFSYYPMNLEILYMLPMYFKNDIIPKFIHFSFALATAWLIFVYLKKRISTVYGLFGALLFLTIPIIVKLSITVYVDLGLVFFSTASIILLLQWVENKFKLKFLIFSGVFCGLALGTKYNGMIIFFLLSLFVPVLYLRSYRESTLQNSNDATQRFNQLKSLGYLVIYILSALIIFSPWMARNYIWKRNPIYPIYNKLINPPKKTTSDSIHKRNKSSILGKEIKKQSKSRWGHFSIRRFIYKESWWQISLVPLRIFFQGKDGDPKHFDGKLNPFLLILPFFAFINRKKDSLQIKRETIIFIFFSIAFVVYAFFAVDMRIRYISPIIPPLIILSVYGFKKILEIIKEKCPIHRKIFFTLLATASISLFMLINLSYILEQFKYVDPFSFISGKVSRDEYIEKYRSEYPVVQYANKNLSEKSKILSVFLGNRRYYSDREMVFNEKLFLETIKTSKSSEKALEKLKNKSITHIILWDKLFVEWARINFDKKKLAMLQLFFKDRAKLLFASGGYRLYQLANKEKE